MALDPTPAPEPKPTPVPGDPEPEPPVPSDPEPDDDGKYKSIARKQEQKYKDAAKERDAYKAELDDLRKASLSDQEKAVADAAEQARLDAWTKAIGAFGARIVDAEVRAAAAGRAIDVDALLEGLDRMRFLTDDGEADVDGIRAWVDKVAPAAPRKPGVPGQGVPGAEIDTDPRLEAFKAARDRRRGAVPPSPSN